MKKILLLSVLLCIQLFTAKAQFVTIPNANFVTKLTQLFPSCMNGNQMDTTCAQIVNATNLQLANLNLTNLSGIQYFDHLALLNCSNSNVQTIPKLPNSLEHFNCQDNNLSMLPDLPSTIHSLYCAENQLTSLPVLPINLKNLEIGWNNIINLPALPNSLETFISEYNYHIILPQTLPSSLITLECMHDSLDMMPILPSSLKSLSFYNNQLSSLPVLPDSLESLEVSYNNIAVLPALPNTMQYLGCSHQSNPLISVPVLPSSLLNFDCSFNQITSLPDLPDSLEHFTCRQNNLTHLPELPSTLKSLDCSGNQITSLPAIPNVLYSFMAYDNNITCLVNLPMVTGNNQPSISNNPLTCVPNQTTYSLGLPLCIENDTINNPNNCSGVNIAGYVFTNLDTNCIYNNTDLQTQNIPVQLLDNQNNLLALSYTINGVYSFANLQPDTFRVKIDDSVLPVAIDCGQLNIQTLYLNSTNQSLLGNNFPVVCDEPYDLRVQSVSRQGFVFPGQTHNLSTNITSNQDWFNLDCGSSSFTGTVSIQVFGPVNSITPAANTLTPTINGNIFTYNINNFDSITPSSFNLLLTLDTTANTNQQVCVQVEITSSPIDAEALNNTYNFCYEIGNSYDPNMKEVYPVDVLPGYEDWFTYTIHFQNTGNAPAFNIRLRDTLDMQLDLNTFEVLGYSHDATITLYNNILTVRFNNIMLPDSTSDYEGSMGYFQYRLKPLPNLPNGTQIENTAYIYFDYNAPIVTNTTQNNFDITVGKLETIATKNEFVLFPNPSNGIFNFKDTKNLKQVEVYNLLGEQILTQGNPKQINLSGFAKGIYYVKINGEVVVKLVKE